MSRARQARLLAWPTARLAAWRAMPAAGAVAVTMVQFDGPHVIELRLAAIALCVGAAFMLDDPAAQSLAASPTPLLFRRLLRIALLLPLIAGLWAVVLWRAGENFTTALTLELLTMLVITLAAAAIAAPLVPDGRGGLAAAPALLTLLAAALLVLPAGWTLFARDPTDPAWELSHIRWALVLTAAVAALLAASRDPANPRARPARLRRFIASGAGRRARRDCFSRICDSEPTLGNRARGNHPAAVGPHLAPGSESPGVTPPSLSNGEA